MNKLRFFLYKHFTKTPCYTLAQMVELLEKGYGGQLVPGSKIITKSGLMFTVVGKDA